MNSLPRKTFISYSWTSPEHEQWVLDLATQLRENGVDVSIDKWDLKEGHDAIAFMEKMVTDAAIQKVILVLDRGYAEKSNSKKGGVGTESQIISPEIYARTDQNKFAGVVSELDADGKPYLPAFYRSRIYIDLSNSDTYAQNFDQLLRWIYDKPSHPKPALGKPPEFLNETTVLLPTRSRARRAIELLRSGFPTALAALDEYLTALAGSLENLRIVQKDNEQFDELVILNIESFLPYRDEFIEVVSTVARIGPSAEHTHILHRFFELLIPYLDRPKHLNQWNTTDFDNFKFIVHELFLYTISILLLREQFSSVLALLSTGYYASGVLEDSRNPMQPYTIFRSYLASLKYRNERLGLRRLSLHADLLKGRNETSGIPFESLMQADFVLYLYDAVSSLKTDSEQKWWPETLVWLREYAGPFEIFARAESRAYFEKMRAVVNLQSKEEFEKMLPNFGMQNARIYIPRWEWQGISIPRATNLEKLATKP